MKRITLSLLTLLAFSFSATAAGPVAPKESADTPSAAPAASPASSTGTPPSAGSTGADQSTAPGQSQPAASPATEAMPGSDQAFIQKAAELNRYEIELTKAAARISGSPEIRKAAKTIERDLTAVRQQLESLAKSKGITLPTSLPQALQDKLTAAESRTAGQFDRSYLNDQIELKQQTIILFEREGGRTTDVDIKSWTEQTLPGLKNHLTILKSTTPPAVGEKSAPQKKQ